MATLKPFTVHIWLHWFLPVRRLDFQSVRIHIQNPESKAENGHMTHRYACFNLDTEGKLWTLPLTGRFGGDFLQETCKWLWPFLIFMCRV